MKSSLKLILLIGIVLLALAVYSSCEEAETKPEVETLEMDRSAPKKETAVKSNEDVLKTQAEALHSGEKVQFQAEINQLLDILIKSLYTNKDIFLRELISNASDALDKIRFISLTDKEAMAANADMEIFVSADKKTNTITIRDTGVGMTKEDLVNSLGTIASSGTKSFLEKLQESSDSNNLIGQFGVGFYSSFLVAETVTVTTKNNADKQYIWSSEADQTFTLVEDPRGDTLGRGTEIILHLKEDAAEYLEQDRLEKMIRRYSEFVHFPIHLWTVNNVTKEVEVEPEVKPQETKPEDEKPQEAKPDDEVEVTEEKKEEAPKKKETKKVHEIVREWKLINNEPPIWTRSPKKVQDDEYLKFYKVITNRLNKKADQKEKDAKYLTKIHFKAEGNIEFSSILYIPDREAQNTYSPEENTQQNGVGLYVKRVFITDSIPDFMPRYLNFIRGVIDSDDLPLHVSRELLQESTVLKTIKRKLVSKSITMIRKLANDEKKKRKEKEMEDLDKKEAGDDEEEDLIPTEEEEFKFQKFWKDYGKNIKLGVVEDPHNRHRLTKLVRFYSTKSEFKLTSFDEYVERMPDNQEYIYYISCANIEQCRLSPFLEELRKRNFEVIYFSESIDAYMVNNIPTYDNKDLVSVSREGLKFGDDENKERKETKEELEKEFKPLLKFLKKQIGENIQKAEVSNRLNASPCVLVAPKYGPDIDMIRIMRGQAFGRDLSPVNKMMVKQRILEINPYHPVIKELNKKVVENENDSTARSISHLLFETALLRSGYHIENSALFASRIYNMMETSLNIQDEYDDEEDEPLNATDISGVDASNVDATEDTPVKEAAAKETDEKVQDQHEEL